MRSPEERLTELEIKSSYADDLLEQLNEIVARQQLQIDALLRELQMLRQQMRDQPAGESMGSGHEPPPHY
jgi:SlyX protein